MAFITSSKQGINVSRPKFNFMESKSSIANNTFSISWSTVFACPLLHCFDCKARKKEESRTFKSGNYGDCVINEIFQFPEVAAATN
jgi:hypothetical protein